MATRTLGLIAGFVVALASFQPATPAAPAAEATAAAATSSSPWAVNDPHLLFLFSQMEMAMGDVNSAVALADRAAELERAKKTAPQAQPISIDEDCPLAKQTAGRS